MNRMVCARPATSMLLHSDFTAQVRVTPDVHHWVASPQGGVQRMMLDRIGEESARATSLVRYAADSKFPAHQHPGGEEILVLDGVFSDETGDYPAGWYLRNPPGSAHRPASKEGALIFVKLQQMPRAEARSVRIDASLAANWQREASRHTCMLYEDAYERVYMQRLRPGDELEGDCTEGMEILVTAGELVDLTGTYAAGSWLRLPAAATPALRAAETSTTLYVKTGHLGRHLVGGRPKP